MAQEDLNVNELSDWSKDSLREAVEAPEPIPVEKGPKVAERSWDGGPSMPSPRKEVVGRMVRD